MNTIDIGKILGRELQDQSVQNEKKNSTGAGSFGDMLKNSINEVNNEQMAANRTITGMATGEAESIHSTLIAMEKADLSFKLMMQVRNKVLDAYREVMRMQV